MKDRYEIEDALKTLMRAEEIKADKKLMKDVFSLAKEQKESISSIEDLKMAYEKALKKENEEEMEDDEEESSKDSVSAKRYEKAKKEANDPEIPMVKVVE